MVKNNNGFKFNIENIEKEVKSFCDKNQLPEQLSTELLYVSKSFALFFNHCVSAKEKYDITQILDLFYTNLHMQAEAFGIGLGTSAGEFFLYIPLFAKKINELKELDILDTMKEKEARLAQKERSLKESMKRVNDTEATLKEREKEIDKKLKSLKGNSSGGSSYGNCWGGSYVGHC